MTALEELTEFVRKAATDVGPAVVSIGRDGRGSGFVVRARARRDERPQPARPHHVGTVRRRSDGSGNGDRK